MAAFYTFLCRRKAVWSGFLRAVGRVVENPSCPCGQKVAMGLLIGAMTVSAAINPLPRHPPESQGDTMPFPAQTLR
jgi:hypothetical protein